MKKLRKRWAVILLIIIFIICLSMILSFSKFRVWNPISSGIGLIRIIATDKNYVMIQESSRVVLAKPDDSWKLFLRTMEEQNYKYLSDEQMGSLCAFEKNGEKERVFFSSNRYYSLWIWEDK